MRKFILIILLLICFSGQAHASQVNEELFEKISDSVNVDTKELLSDFGIEIDRYDDLLNIEFSNVVNQFLRLCRNEMKRPLQTAVCVCVYLLILSVVKVFISSSEGLSTIISSLSTVLLALLLVLPVSQTFTDVMSSFVVTHDFMKVMIPIFGGIITALGKPSLAICLQGTVFSTTQIVASFFRKSLPVVCVIYLSLCICSCTSEGSNAYYPAQSLKKMYFGVLSFCSALFSALLTVKSVITASADTLTVKGIKFIIGNTVPVVGGALSEALNSVISGLALLKSSVGFISIIILILTNLPLLVELLMWTVMLKIMSSIASVTSMNNEMNLIENISGLFSIFGVVVIYLVFLYVISVSLIAVVAGMR